MFLTGTGAAVMTAIPLSYVSFGYTWIWSAMTITDGLAHLLGSMPREPTPRVTRARM
jgi:hypothetical protein